MKNIKNKSKILLGGIALTMALSLGVSNTLMGRHIDPPNGCQIVAISQVEQLNIRCMNRHIDPPNG